VGLDGNLADQLVVWLADCIFGWSVDWVLARVDGCLFVWFVRSFVRSSLLSIVGSLVCSLVLRSFVS
jgi:hypothetical protein